MKRQFKLTQKSMETIKRTFGMVGFVMIAMFTSNTTYAQTNTATSTVTSDQQLTVKGTVGDDDGPLEGVSIIKKGTVIGTATDKNGTFIFPKPLKTGDTLLFSYLGYEEVEVKIDKNTTFIKLILTSDVVEMMGALQTEKPYKSKRKN